MKLQYDKKEFIAIHDTLKEMWVSTMQLGMAALEQNRILTEKRLDIEIARLDLDTKQQALAERIQAFQQREQELRKQSAGQASRGQTPPTGKGFAYGYTTGSNDAK